MKIGPLVTKFCHFVLGGSLNYDSLCNCQHDIPKPARNEFRGSRAIADFCRHLAKRKEVIFLLLLLHANGDY